MAEAKVKIHKDDIARARDAAIAEGLTVAFLSLSRIVRAKLSMAGGGRVYRIGKGKKSGRNLRARGFHRASAPGFPPAVDTGRLRASFITDSLGRWKYGYATIDKRENRTVLTYGSSVVYAPVMEFGNRRGTIKPRPYLRPSLAVLRPRLKSIFEIAFKRQFGATKGE